MASEFRAGEVNCSFTYVFHIPPSLLKAAAKMCRQYCSRKPTVK
jgi:hypothetical protein